MNRLSKERELVRAGNQSGFTLVELYTAEREEKPLFRVSGVRVVSLR